MHVAYESFVIFGCNILYLKLQAFSDADLASYFDTRRSVTGYILLLGNFPIIWKLKKQNTVSKSSAEAKYRATTLAAIEVTWVVRLLDELGVSNLKSVKLYCDNPSTLMHIDTIPIFVTGD